MLLCLVIGWKLPAGSVASAYMVIDLREQQLGSSSLMLSAVGGLPGAFHAHTVHPLYCTDLLLHPDLESNSFMVSVSFSNWGNSPYFDEWVLAINTWGGTSLYPHSYQLPVCSVMEFRLPTTVSSSVTYRVAVFCLMIHISTPLPGFLGLPPKLTTCMHPVPGWVLRLW